MEIWIRNAALLMVIGLMVSPALAQDDAAEAPAEQVEPADERAEADAEELTEDQKISYAIGMMMAQGFPKDTGLELDQDLLGEAFATTLNGQEPRMNQQQAAMVLQQFMVNAQQRIAEANAKKGQALLDENAEREDVKTTDSGLQYQMIEEGEGDPPAATDTVLAHYKGMLPDGTVFDSSYERGQPAQFELNRVIPGWTEGLQLMKPGSKYKLYIPGKLAYGPRGQPQAGIGPNQLLIFEVELLEVNPEAE